MRCSEWHKLAMAAGAFWTLGPLFSVASELNGRIVSVTDGDTVKMLTADSAIEVIRIAAIDAPERRQAFGDRAREKLAASVIHHDAVATCNKRDRYRRRVCSVHVNGHDVGLSLVRDGYAWHDRRFAREQSLSGRYRYAQAEQFAREHRLGLWGSSSPEPPWLWRRVHWDNEPKREALLFPFFRFSSHADGTTRAEMSEFMEEHASVD